MKKKIAIFLCIAMLLVAFAGCANNQSDSSTEAPEESSSETSENIEIESTVPEDTTAPNEENSASPTINTTDDAYTQAVNSGYGFPISDELLTYSFLDQSNPTATHGLEDSEYFSLLEQLGNVKFEYTMFPMATFSEQFNLMVASEDLPEILASSNYSGSASQAVQEEVYRDIAPFIEQYAPDYYNLVQSVDAARQSLYTDEGFMTSMAMIAEKEFSPNNGVIIRQDIVDKYLNGESPVTYDDYHEYLSILKNEVGMEAPLFITGVTETLLSAGYDIRLNGFTTNDNNELVYGILTDEAPKLMKFIRDWYNEGLIYQEFFAIPDGSNNDYLISMASNNQTGMIHCWCEFANQIAFPDGSEAVLGPGCLPRFDKNEQLHLSEGVDRQVRNSWIFSGNCSDEKLEVILRLMNFFYTEAGAHIANWGVEGKTYTIQEDGTPWFTDLIIENPDGYTRNEALMSYLAYWSPHYADYTKFNIGMVMDFAQYVDVWATTDIAHEAPAYSMTVEESDISAGVATDISTLMDETLIKFITGDLDIDTDWDSFIEDLYSIGMQDFIDVNNSAYARYISK